MRTPKWERGRKVQSIADLTVQCKAIPIYLGKRAKAPVRWEKLKGFTIASLERKIKVGALTFAKVRDPDQNVWDFLDGKKK